MQFHKFFFECSIKEPDNIIKKLYTLLALNSGGGLIFERGHYYYLSLEDNTEFKIPLDYDKAEHDRLTNAINKYRPKLC